MGSSPSSVAHHARDAAVGLVASNSLEYVERFFELLSQHRVVVPLRSPDDQVRIDACGISDIEVPKARHGWFSGRLELDFSDSLAQIAFTSGTEGEPKGVLLTHRNLSSTVQRIQQAMDMDADIREYIGVPVYHSFGFGRCRAVASCGGKFYIPEKFDLREIATLLAAGEINAVSAVPTLWRVVLRNAAVLKEHAHKMRWIEIGSQPMSRDEKAALRELFPAARIVQHYGLTEASRSTFLHVDRARGEELESVGAPNGDVEVRIDTSGQIQIRGSNVAVEILIAGNRVRNVDDEGWLTTHDLGALRDGKLFFLGRSDDMMNLGGLKFAPEAIEQRMGELIGSTDGYCIVRIPDAARGDGVLLAVSEALQFTDDELSAAAKNALRDLGVEAAASLSLLRLDELPRTDSGKPKRREIAERFELSEVGKSKGSAADGREGFWAKLRKRKPKTIRDFFQRAFPGAQLTGDQTFVQLGGDSLSFVELAAALEGQLGFLPQEWQNLSIRELEATEPRHARLHPVDVSVFLRGVGIVAVVSGHFDLLPIPGATFLLLVISGYMFARFQLPNVLATGAVGSVVASAFRIGLPTFLAIAVLAVKHSSYDLMDLALLDNWTDAWANDLDFWYLELLFQLLLLVALLLSFRAIRGRVKRAPFSSAMVLLGISATTAIFGPLVWDTLFLWNRVPHMLMWLFALGWVLRVAESRAQRLSAAALVIVLPVLVWRHSEDQFWLGHSIIWVWLGCAIMMLVDEVKVPSPLNKIVSVIASASMFIYILHSSVFNVWGHLGFVHHPLIDVVLAVTAGILGSWTWDAANRVALRWLSKRRQTTESQYRPI